MIPFYSKHNQVFPILWNGKRAVEKHFLRQTDWEREVAIYRSLSLPCPELLDVGHNSLVLAYCPFPTLLEELERQELSGFSPRPWEALAAWLQQCAAQIQLLPDDGNLRNFLWDEARSVILGLDFEGYSASSLQQCGGKIIASLLEYDPADTPVKRQCAQLLGQLLQVPATLTQQLRLELQCRRGTRETKKFSAIILAGGKSSRMGRDKAGLKIGDQTFLEHQVEKVRALGIEDIILSGEGCPPLSGTRVVADELPGRGPLGGLHACLRNAKNSCCLVLSVDVPLIPLSTLAQLCRAHTQGITVLCHESGEEPLIGVYDSFVADAILPLIQQESAPVRKLRQSVQWNTFFYMGPQEYLMNCNTPQEFAQLLSQQKSVETFVKQ